jgi:hypothetical protein
MNIASHVCDPKLVARLLGVRSIVNYHFFRLSEAPLEQAEIHRFHAMMLMDRAASGDRERARRLLCQARETYGQIGMRAHREITQILLD